VEQIRSLQLRAAAVEVAQVVQAEAHEADVRRRQTAEGHDALTQGDHDGWLAASAQTDAAEMRQRRLEPLYQAREAFRLQANAVHQASRLRLEQMEGIVERTQARQTLEDERRAQAASDDRFLSRKMWLKARQD
jgi:hypothetical protein